jgi:hypothetical protein
MAGPRVSLRSGCFLGTQARIAQPQAPRPPAAATSAIVTPASRLAAHGKLQHPPTTRSDVQITTIVQLGRVGEAPLNLVTTDLDASEANDHGLAFHFADG